MTNSEINEAVARKLGWEEDSYHAWQKISEGYVMEQQRQLPDYCHSIAVAWEIVDQWHGDYIVGRQNGRFHCTLFRPSEEFEGWADTAPRAICLAFLKGP